MRRIATTAIAAIILVAIGVFAWRTFNPGPLAFAGGTTVALADYHEANPTGVPADLAKADIVKRGEYLAKAADCMVCHTAPGGAEYAGGLAFPLPFGTLYSTNITADKDTGIGTYSDKDFLDAVQRGVRKDGARLYPAMPYTSYTYMTDADVLAIKAYLFSLPPCRGEPARHAAISVQPALVDDLLVMGVQSQYALCAQYREKRRVEQGRLYRRGDGALRRLSHAAQPRLCARQPAEIRRCRRGRLARL